MTNDRSSSEDILKRLGAIESRLDMIEGKKSSNAASTPAPGAVPVPGVPLPPVPDRIKHKSKGMTEVQVGQTWLTVAGIILIFLAAVLLVRYAFQFYGPFGKIAIAYGASIVLFVVALLARKKHGLFASIVGAGAWGVTYLTTYALYFFPSTKIVESVGLEMFMLSIVVGALLVISAVTSSKWMAALSVVLGFLTIILSPVHLFSLLGIGLLAVAFVALSRLMKWGDLVTATSLGAFVSYLLWLSADGIVPEDAGWLGVGVLAVSWLAVFVGVRLRKDVSESFGGFTDHLALLVASFGLSVYGSLSVADLVGGPNALRWAGVFLLVVAAMHGAFALWFKTIKRNVVVMHVAVLSTVLTLVGIALVLPEASRWTSLSWAGLALAMGAVGYVTKRPNLLALGSFPALAGAAWFFLRDAMVLGDPAEGVVSLILLAGLAHAIVLVASGAMLRKYRSAWDSLDLLLIIQSGAAVAAVFTGLWMQFDGAMVSILWGVLGLVAIAAGFALRWAVLRHVGIGAMLVTVGRVLFIDMQEIGRVPRIVSSAVVGVVLLLVGFAYSKNKDKIEKFLKEESER